MERGEPSVVEDQGSYASSCGYCKSSDPTSHAYGLWAQTLSPYDYQELLDKSWRRSGMILYKPESEKSCCPSYTIRLKVDAFKKSKEHIRTMRRMQRYLDGTYNSSSLKEEEHRWNDDATEDRQSDMDNVNMDVDDMRIQQQSSCSSMDGMNQALTEFHFTATFLATEIGFALQDCIVDGDYPDDVMVPKISVQRYQRKSSRSIGKQIGYTSGVAFSCAALLLKHKRDCRIVKSAWQQSEEGTNMENSSMHRRVAAVLADKISSQLWSRGKMPGIRVESVNGHLNFFRSAVSDHDQVIMKASTPRSTANQKASSGVTLSRDSLMPSQPPERGIKSHKLEIQTTPSLFDAEEYSLYRRYQIVVHKENPEEITEATYRRFLVDTPLRFVPPPMVGTPFWGFGSFHQRYLLNGHLVAVGVIDILPLCLSSNYFFWDPDFAFLSLGKYSALKEIELVQEAKRYCESLGYYYLGHYIHSCAKMHYKVAFRPSELLCPVRSRWVPFDIAGPLLDKQPFACLSDALYAARLQRQNDGSAAEEDMALPLMGTTSSHMRRDICCNEEVELLANGILTEASGSGISKDKVYDVLLKIENHYLKFKHLQAYGGVPQESLDALMRSLQNYANIVGISLATKMAYALM